MVFPANMSSPKSKYHCMRGFVTRKWKDNAFLRVISWVGVGGALENIQAINVLLYNFGWRICCLFFIYLLLHLPNLTFAGILCVLASPLSCNHYSTLISTLSIKSNVHSDDNHQMTLLSPLASIYGYVFVSLSNSEVWGSILIFFILSIHPVLCYLLQTVFHPEYSIIMSLERSFINSSYLNEVFVKFLVFMWHVI